VRRGDLLRPRAASEAIALVPPGRFDELLADTERIVGFAEEEGRRICATGLVALAGRALALFEAGREPEARRAVELLERFSTSAVELRTYGHPIAELVRPILGPEATRRLIRPPVSHEDAGGAVSRLRVLLPVAALSGSDGELARAIADARSLAGPACAPALGRIADWAEAAAHSRGGRYVEALEAGVAAAAGLAEAGEPYTGDRLLADLLALLPGTVAAPHVDPVARRLTAMGARQSAQLASRQERARPGASPAGSSR
jgi:hypothetical protein